MTGYIAEVLVREFASEESTKNSAEKMSKCPKCLAIGTDGKKLIGAYKVSQEES